MAKVAPHFQTRSQQPRDWGNYASLLVLPNAAGWLGGSSASFPLEEGDTAYVIGSGPAYCVSAGTPGSLNAVWSLVAPAGIVTTAVELDFGGGAPVYSQSFTVIDGTVTPANTILVFQSGVTATGRVGNDLEWDQLLLGAVAGTGQITITALASPGPVKGRRTVLYQVL